MPMRKKEKNRAFIGTVPTINFLANKFRIQPKRLKDFDGFTLVELLVALLITSLLSVGVLKVVGTASLGLERSASEARVGVQAVKFSSQIKYDVSSSRDVFIWGQGSVPTSVQQAALTEKRAELAIRRCVSPTYLSTGYTKTVKELITVKLKVLASAGGGLDSDAATGTYVDTYNFPLVTYELHKLTNNANGLSQYSIWRVRCNLNEIPCPPILGTTLSCYPSGLNFDIVASTEVEKLLDLGFDTNPTSYPASYSGLNFLLCPGGLSCVANTSTSFISNYRLVLPYGGNLRAIRRIDSDNTFNRDLNVQTLARKISL